MQLSIKRFKCYAEFDQAFPSITVLCGRNGAGKSTVIQAILLHHLAIEALRQIENGSVKIALNGPFGLALGAGLDVRHRGGVATKEADTIIGIDNDIIRFWADDHVENDDFLFAEILQRGERLNEVEADRDIPPFVYLSAERIGPRLVQPKRQGYRLSKAGIGAYGENSAEFLKLVQHEKVDQTLAQYSGMEAGWILKHVEYWLSKLFGDISLKVQDNGRFSPPSLQFREGGFHSDWFYPTHHGFGISYALPILLSGLASKANDLIVVDSPEAHLHPAAQTEIAKFLCMLARAGRKVIVETHSDHVLDGLRLESVDRTHEASLSEHSKILFFSRTREGQGCPSIEHIQVRSDGSLSHWPPGFFDQISLNLRSIAEAKRQEVSRGAA